MSDIHVDPENQVDPEDFLRFCLSRRSALKTGAGLAAAGIGGLGLSACSGGQYSGNNSDNNSSGNKGAGGQPTPVSKRAASVSPTPRE